MARDGHSRFFLWQLMSEAFTKRDDGEWVEVTGFVRRLLSDDDESRHQRFIVGVGQRQTLLVAHNLELAERVPVSMGDRVYVRGLYEWNDLGGLLHWTHRDPLADGEGGWVRYRRKTYA